MKGEETGKSSWKKLKEAAGSCNEHKKAKKQTNSWTRTKAKETVKQLKQFEGWELRLFL